MKKVKVGIVGGSGYTGIELLLSLIHICTLTDEQLKAYAVHCRDTQFAMTPEDVLYRRLRIGQMNKAKTEELLLKIKDVFEAEASE